jgi:putative transposase
MAIPERRPGAGTYFVTGVTSSRRRLFQVAANAELFLETLQAYRRQGHYKLHAFVVMPDHIHLLLSPQGETIERVMGLIKGGYSHRLASTGPVWQRGFSDHRIHDAEDFRARRAYIHQNPVGQAWLICRRAIPIPPHPVQRQENRTSAAKADQFSSYGTTEAVPFRSRSPFGFL